MQPLELNNTLPPPGKDPHPALGTPSQQPSETPSADVAPSDDPEASPTPVIDTSPNVMDVDLEAVAESTSNKDIQWLA